MFKFLKEKLKSAVKKFSKDIEEEAEDVEVPEEEIQEEPEEVEEPEEIRPKPVPEKKKDKPKTPKKEKPKTEIPVVKAEPEEEKAPRVEVLEEKEEAAPEVPAVEAPESEEIKEEEIEVPEPEAEETEEEKEVEPEEAEEPEEEVKPKKKGFFSRLFGKKEEEPEGLEEPEEKEEAEEERVEEVKEEKKAPEEETEIEDIDIPPPPAEDEGQTEAEKEEEEEKRIISAEDKELEDVDEEREEVLEDLAEDDEEIQELDKKSIRKGKPEPEQDEAADEDDEDEDEEPEKKGFFGRLKESVSGKKLSESKFEDLFFDLEIALLENNCAVEVIEKIKEDLKGQLVDRKLNRFEIERIIIKTLKKSLEHILTFDTVDMISKVKDKRKAGEPFNIVFVGINGSGKTTTIAKMARYFMDNNLKTVLVAADTFRAAAIQQLEEHANRLNVKMIKHDYGSDPAAVAFDGIAYAKSKGIDVVLIDTAGRLHSNVNLMDEMKKIIRVAKPDMKIFIGESITGNDCVEQAKKFNEAIELDGIVLSKADVDEKGGAAISVSYVTGKPILFLGTGQEYKDLQPFNRKTVLSNLGL
ncbi:TPA: signal recognition particle-docking protein FtsY [Candidatus Woesearchaeota archaeon]|nr:signal recognition particle-docking protein FtsY [Candidatus Woesearchaeota archaeon]